MQLSNRDLGRLPLVLAYGVGPLLAMSTRLGLNPGLAELVGRGLWLAMAGLGLALACAGRERRPFWALAVGLALAAGAALLALIPAWTGGLLAGPVVRAWLGEVAPLAWVGLALLWALLVAAPRRADYLWAGSGLALLVLADFLAASLWNLRPVFSGGVLFPLNLVRVESHATLLLVAHIAGIGEGPGLSGSGRTRLLRLVILAGLLATFSRSALLAAALLAMLADQAPLKARFATALSCMVCAMLPVFIADASALGMDRFEARLEWVSGVQWVLENPIQLLTGHDPARFMDMSLPVSVGRMLLPDEILRLEASSVDSGWLRLLLVWGLWAWAALAAGAALLLSGCLRSCRRVLLGLIMAVMLQGMFFAPLHHPGPAVALVLGLWAVRRSFATGG